MRDIVNHYRTLIGEALMAVDLGHAEEWVEETAYRWGKRIKPAEPVQWQDMGWVEDSFTSQFERPMRLVAEERTAALRESLAPVFEKLGGDVEWGMPAIRAAEATAEAEKAMKFAVADPYPIPFEIPPVFVGIQDHVNEMLKARIAAEENAFRQVFMAGVDPESEWTRVSVESLEKLETIDSTSTNMTDWLLGIPLFYDPEGPAYMRMRTADLLAAPNGHKIAQWLSDHGATVDTDAEPPTTTEDHA